MMCFCKELALPNVDVYAQYRKAFLTVDPFGMPLTLNEQVAEFLREHPSAT